MSKKRMDLKIIWLVLQLLHLVSSLSAEEMSLSTSITSMVKLLEIEMQLIDSVENYAAELQIKMDALKNLVHELKAEHVKSINKEEYLYNPLNCFALIRRLHNDWPEIELFMSRPVGKKYLSMLRQYRPQMPTATDLAEVSAAIYRLQTVYDLKVGDVVRGILNGKQYDAKLKSVDCYFMGYYLFDKELYYPAGSWLNISITNFEEENNYNNIVGFGKEQPLKLYAETLVLQKRPKDALSLIELASELRPFDASIRSRRNEIEFLAKTYNGPPLQWWGPLLSNYELGCRGHFSNTGASKMFCLYNTTTTPFLRLAPIKMEIISMKPYIVIFHDVLTDREMEHLKTLVRPNLKRAGVYNFGLKHEVDEERTAQFSAISNDRDDVIKRINKRIVDMTGFDVTDSELLQVGNYAIGGHYGVHFDFFNVADLSDVEQGGATVFPLLKIAVLPRKGSALMWYNLNNKLEADVNTLHAACPVLVGSKWVCNKWIGANAQIFRRPCYK